MLKIALESVRQKLSYWELNAVQSHFCIFQYFYNNLVVTTALYLLWTEYEKEKWSEKQYNKAYPVEETAGPGVPLHEFHEAAYPIVVASTSAGSRVPAKEHNEIN